MNSSISNFRTRFKRAATILFYFLFFFFLFDRLLFWAFTKYETRFYRTYSLEEKLKQAKGTGSFQALIFGTSRAYEALHPQYISQELGLRAYKEAFVGKGPKYNYFFYQLFKKIVGVPRVVFYGLDYFIFNVDSQRYLLMRFSDKVNERERYASGLVRLWSNKSIIDEFSNNLLNQFNDQWLAEPNFQIERDNDKMEAYTGTPSRGNLETQRPARFRRIRYHRFPGKEGDYLKRLLAELNTDGVTVILVYPPDFEGSRATNFNQGGFWRGIRELIKPYPQVYFFYYNSERKFPLGNPAFFLDGGYGKTNSHLSQAGAVAFNRIFLADVQRELPDLRTPR